MNQKILATCATQTDNIVMTLTAQVRTHDPKWWPVSCQNVVSYDQMTSGKFLSYNLVTTTRVVSYNPVTTNRVVSYDPVATTRVVSYDPVMTTRAVSYDLVTTLTDDSKLLSPSFHGLQEVTTSVGGTNFFSRSLAFAGSRLHVVIINVGLYFL